MLQPESTTNTSLTVESRKSEFVPVTGGAETSSAATLLIVAYALMWSLVFALIWLSARRQKHLDTRLRELEKTLAQLEAQQPPTRSV